MKKKLILALVIFIVIALGVFLFFYQVWNDEQKRIESMKAKALGFSELETIVEVDKYTGEKEYYFVFGKNSKGRDVLVWGNDDEVTITYLDSWYTKEEIREKAESVSPENKIQRINAGIDSNSVFLYEVLFKDAEGKLGYMYYDMLSGDLMKMYKLGRLGR